MQKTLAIIGLGNMGGDIAKSLLDQKIFPKESLFLFDRSEEKRYRFAEGATIEHDLEKSLSKSDAVLLCIKPQGVEDFFAEHASSFRENTLLLSILAGTSIKTLQTKSGLTKIIRIMPNTPAQVGMGVSGFFASEEVSGEEQKWTEKILRTFGIAIACNSEDQINAITALSGSGPAYFFRILEILAQEGEFFGFSAEEAKAIALQTLLGAGTLAKQSEDSFEVLRQKVTSKGGTTETALNSFEKNNLAEVLHRAIQSAYKRAEELGKN